VTEAAEKFGVSRQSIYRWMLRYEQGGLDGLAERSHKPRSSPHQIAPGIEARVLELRRQHPGWGPLRILHQLEREKVRHLPSHMAIYRALVRHRLIEPNTRRKRLPAYKRWERGRPMELWQMDVVGGVLLEDGTEAKVLTGVDDHSRFCVCAGIMTRATGRAVCGSFAEALERHGVPTKSSPTFKLSGSLGSAFRPAGGMRILGTGAYPLPLLTDRSVCEHDFLPVDHGAGGSNAEAVLVILRTRRPTPSDPCW